MNVKRHILLLIIGSVIWFGCESKKSSENDQAVVSNREIPAEAKAEETMHDQIMAVHDEVMPKMDIIMNVKGQLLEKLDSLRDLSNSPETTIELISSSVAALEEADENMMNWMRNWNPPADTVSHDKKMDFYKVQQKAIDMVSNNMKQSIDSATMVLKSIQ